VGRARVLLVYPRRRGLKKTGVIGKVETKPLTPGKLEASLLLLFFS
jgi:hypothetical protein